MSMLFDKDVYLHERIIPGQPGAGMDEAEFAALRNDIGGAGDGAARGMRRCLAYTYILIH